MNRNILVAGFIAAASAAALWFASGGKALAPACPGPAEIHDAMPDAAVRRTGFIRPDAASSRRQLTFQVVLVPPPAGYLTNAAAAAYAQETVRAVAAVFSARYETTPAQVRVVLLPPDNMLLTDDIPPMRAFERSYDEAALEHRFGVALGMPVLLLSGLDAVPVRLAIEEMAAREAAALLGATADDPFWAERGAEVNGLVFSRMDIRLLAAAAAAGRNVIQDDVVLVDTDAGDVLMAGPLPLEPPDMFPVPLMLSDSVPREDTALRLKLVDAYERERSSPPAGVLLAGPAGLSYETSADTRQRALEEKSVVAWGLRRFPLADGVSLHDGWRYVVIHHTASEAGNLETIDHYHRDIRGWANGAGYHFIIGNGNGMKDGEIVCSTRWTRQLTGAHVGNPDWNRMSIGVALVGNFEEDKPSEKQLKSLVKLARFLAAQNSVPIQKIIGHRDCPIAHTLCPGANFPWTEFRKRLKETSSPPPPDAPPANMPEPTAP
ncbi:MAG: N-acetylmuramoyl-L-alanine amidase [Planctomycetes bacterium]|nr:N-acetylmuramoyl-L-alanine amidase [Planctomycetota bacterium]